MSSDSTMLWHMKALLCSIQAGWSFLLLLSVFFVLGDTIVEIVFVKTALNITNIIIKLIPFVLETVFQKYCKVEAQGIKECEQRIYTSLFRECLGPLPQQ